MFSFCCFIIIIMKEWCVSTLSKYSWQFVFHSVRLIESEKSIYHIQYNVQHIEPPHTYLVFIITCSPQSSILNPQRWFRWNEKVSHVNQARMLRKGVFINQIVCVTFFYSFSCTLWCVCRLKFLSSERQ